MYYLRSARLLVSTFVMNAILFGPMVPNVEAASNNTLIKNGVYAAAYGEVLFDKGDWNGENMSVLRVKAGLQVARFGMLSFGLGYQKNGFYTATRSWNRKSGSANIDYRGPVLDIALVPEDGFYFASFAVSANDGYLFRKELDQADYPYRGCDGLCTVALERDRLNVQEISLQAGIKIARELYFTVGAGTRAASGRTFYEVYETDPKLSRYVKDDEGKWSGSQSYVMLGLRGSQL